ncbi:helix-turn-helix domain-containing protein [Hymenobacter crusticola]|uniref:HTH araC/xylS-type domain-containing protein n=1 Tax=Hymenobacter crusticola TaxID=1770526 RepID=A0A243W671_9BACT|nr:helix-turn-helix domain-containing protein [Hymenobacter crusticola]OUJ69822.1 hypothetical protein BXP70_25970 [Hymenobacter crusticola]
MSEFQTINSISQLHGLLGLGPPMHPLVSVITKDQRRSDKELDSVKYIFNLYIIAQKSGESGSFGYGRHSYDFQNGTLVFTSPGQVVNNQQLVTQASQRAAWVLLFHPDLLRKSALSTTIEAYSFFSYQAREALPISQEEGAILQTLHQQIQQEYSRPCDDYTSKLLSSTIELLLDYCARYFDRQFARRSPYHQDTLSQFETFLKTYFASDQLSKRGLPTVQYCAQELGMAPNYLGDILKKETGQNAQYHIHALLLEKAKTLLISSSLPISQVAYALGFEYPQHFSKLFKQKTGVNPSAYRNAS